MSVVTVPVGASQDLRPLVVWQGTGPRSGDEILVAFERFPRRQRWLDEARTRWAAEIDVPVGRVVTMSRGRWPSADAIFLATADGLQQISYEAAIDHLDPDPSRIQDRADQRILDLHADAAGIPRELTRFVGAHDLQDGIHPRGNSLYYAERCTRRQAYWRRLTLAEWRAYETSALRAGLETFQAAWAES